MVFDSALVVPFFRTFINPCGSQQELLRSEKDKEQTVVPTDVVSQLLNDDQKVFL